MNLSKIFSKPFVKHTKNKRIYLKNSKNNAPTKDTILMGQIQNLYISRITQHGAYLIAQPLKEQDCKILPSPMQQNALSASCTLSQDSAQIPLNEVLLPNKFLPPQHHINDKLEVFVYTDSKDRPIATTQNPKAQCNDIAILEVVGHNAFGCFLDLGIDKDLFMPCKNPTHFSLHQHIAVAITLDKQSRLIAKSNIKAFLQKNATSATFAPHNKVKAFVFERTPLGFGCAVQGEKDTKKYYGLLFHNAIPQGECVNLGTYINAYTQGYRPDSKLNLTLFAPHNDAQKSLLLDSMPLDLNFSASPETIFERFHISKKLFKRLINELVREGEITFDKQSAMFKRIK